MASEGWTIVSGSRKANRRRNRNLDSNATRYSPSKQAGQPNISSSSKRNTTPVAEQSPENPALVMETKKLVERSMQKVRSSKFYASFLSQLRSSVLRQSLSGLSDIVVYGLGSISTSEVSRCQLALVLLVQQELPRECKIHVYDPVTSASESRVLRDFGCHPIEFNERGLRKVAGPTLFYMPHCEVELYDNVLRANWEQLGSVVMLGNSFRGYKQRWESHPNPSSAYPVYVLGVQPRVTEHHVDAMDFPTISAFNDLSWHFFSPERGQLQLS